MSRVCRLTAREMQIAELVAEGLKNSEIATELLLTVDTAKTYVQRILVTTDSRNRVELTLWYLKAVGRLRPPATPPAVPAPRREEDLCLATR